jgi:hypothetical protein
VDDRGRRLSVLVVVVLVWVVTMQAVDVVDVIAVDHRLVPAAGSVDVHVAGVRLVDVFRAAGADLDAVTDPVVEVTVVEEVQVLAVTDDGVATQLVMDVRVLGGGVRSCRHAPISHAPIICLLGRAAQVSEELVA